MFIVSSKRRADEWRSIPWASPWFDAWRDTGRAVLQGWSHGASIATALNVHAASNAPADFVAQSALPPGEAYEPFIARTGTIPTRDNLHDFFNGLVWLRFPQSKRRLNELQAAEIARSGVQATRGPLRDALTMFDENGAVLDAPPVLWEALIARDWRRLFVAERAQWSQARLLVFGHALLDKLVSRRKAATAHVLLAPGAIKSIANDDAAIAAALAPAHLASKPFTPLPVLGVPGWWPGNANFCFYDDSDVFRRRGARKESTNNSRSASLRAA